jgi:hypothetical protein
MAVAQLLRGERLELSFVLFEPGHPQFFNGLSYRRFIGRFVRVSSLTAPR